jgi:hypothetical protein
LAERPDPFRSSSCTSEEDCALKEPPFTQSRLLQTEYEAVPFYVFISRTWDGLQENDPVRLDLPDLDAAQQKAEARAAEILADDLASGREIDGRSFEIADDRGNVLLVYPFPARNSPS